MPAPLFITTEKRSSTLPLLIVDKPGELSKGLISLLSEHFPTILASEKLTLPHLTRVKHVSYKRSIPSIPDEHFSSLLLFYHGEKALRDGMGSFVKKAKENNAKLILITSRELASTPAIQKTLDSYENAHLIIYGAIFGLATNEEGVIAAMISQAAHTGRILVHASGLSENFPVYYPDLLQAMLQVLLAHRPVRIGLAYPRKGVPEIHLARLIQKHYPHAEVVFSKQDSPKEHAVSIEGTYLLTDPYPLSEKLDRLEILPSSVSHMGAPSSLPPPARVKKKRRLKKRFLTFGVPIIVFIFLVPFISVGFFLLGLLSIHISSQAAKRNDLGLVTKRARTARAMFTVAGNTSGLLQLLSIPTGQTELFGKYRNALDAGKDASDVAEYLTDASLLYQGIAKNNSSASGQEMVRVAADIKHAMLGLDRLRASKLLPASYQRELTRYAGPLEKLSGIIELLPYLTGVPKPQVYLVLFQNNMELRPGGGFIGSYGLLTVRNGTIASFSIHDVYDADGQLTGHVEPPYGLRRYLGASHWFLRDSNYDIDFSQNAAQAASFLNLSTGEKVDGVIAMDVSFLRTLLQKTGPVYLPAQNKTVTAKNFYLLVQDQAEKNFFPGSSQKKDFLQHVARALIMSLQDREQLPLGALLLAANDAIDQKHLMVASANKAMMTQLINSGLAPSLRLKEVEKQAGISDYFGLSEANVGVNKANYYIKRSIRQSLNLKETGEREGEATITYANSSKPNSPYGGDYKNYLRVVLPKGTTVSTVSLDGEEQTLIPAVTSTRVFSGDDFASPEGLELEEMVEGDKSLFGFYLEVPAGKTKTVQIKYVSPAPPALSESFTYVLHVAKQPGTDFDPYSLSLSIAPTFAMTTVPDFAGRIGNSVQVVRDLGTDLLLPVSLAKE